MNYGLVTIELNIYVTTALISIYYISEKKVVLSIYNRSSPSFMTFEWNIF